MNITKEAPLFVEIEYAQRKKQGEGICGDSFALKQVLPEQRRIAVLSDGLGSGVKANILSCMTAQMAVRFVADNKEIQETVKVIMDALPICKVRKISYATLTIVDTFLSGETQIIEMGNPPVFHIRDNDLLQSPQKSIGSPGWHHRTLKMTSTTVKPEDRLIMFSDGITQAGLGTNATKLGWRLQGCLDFSRERIRQKPRISARQLSTEILSEALTHEIGHEPHDDMTCAVMYFRQPRRTIVMTGPPYHQERDREIAQRLSEYPGKKIICGGTTANIIARELQQDLTTPLTHRGKLPPISFMDGIDLVTEGILTLTRSYQLLKQRDLRNEDSAAADLTELLRESDIIEFYVGTRINEAHQDPSLPRELEIRRNIVKRIAQILDEEYFKEIHIHYI